MPLDESLRLLPGLFCKIRQGQRLYLVGSDSEGSVTMYGRAGLVRGFKVFQNQICQQCVFVHRCELRRQATGMLDRQTDEENNINCQI
jgi:hypothetical protein